MSTLALLGIAVGLAMDAFAVSIATGLSLPSVTPRHTFRMAFHFGLFQFLMPVVGWLGGRQVAEYVSPYDHWIAMALLSYVGGRMLWDAWQSKDPESKTDPTRGLMLVTLCIATSLDALAVGFSMAFLNVSIWGPAVIIGLVAGTLSAAGILFGGRLGPRAGRWAEVVGGCVLIGIGIRIVVEHLR